MAKLTYWVCINLQDSSVYSIRAKSRKDAIAQRNERGVDNYGEPVKHEIIYRDAFDLAKLCLGEARGFE